MPSADFPNYSNLINPIRLMKKLIVFVFFFMYCSPVSMAQQDAQPSIEQKYWGFLEFADTCREEEYAMLIPMAQEILNDTSSALSVRKRINLNLVMGNVYTSISHLDGLKEVLSNMYELQKRDSLNVYLPGIIEEYKYRIERTKNKLSPFLDKMRGIWVSAESTYLGRPYLILKIENEIDSIQVVLSGKMNDKTCDMFVSPKNRQMKIWFGDENLRKGSAILAATVSIVGEQVSRSVTRSIAVANRNKRYTAKRALQQGLSEIGGMFMQALAKSLATSWQTMYLTEVNIQELYDGIAKVSIDYYVESKSSEGAIRRDSSYTEWTLYKLGITPDARDIFIRNIKYSRKEYKKDSLQRYAGCTDLQRELLASEENVKDGTRKFNLDTYRRMYECYEKAFESPDCRLDSVTKARLLMDLDLKPRNLFCNPDYPAYPIQAKKDMLFQGIWKVRMPWADRSVEYLIDMDELYGHGFDVIIADLYADTGVIPEDIFNVSLTTVPRGFAKRFLVWHDPYFGKLFFNDYNKESGRYMYEGYFKNKKFHGKGKIFKLDTSTNEYELMEEGEYVNGKLKSKGGEK